MYIDNIDTSCKHDLETENNISIAILFKTSTLSEQMHKVHRDIIVLLFFKIIRLFKR